MRRSTLFRFAMWGLLCLAPFAAQSQGWEVKVNAFLSPEYKVNVLSQNMGVESFALADKGKAFLAAECVFTLDPEQPSLIVSHRDIRLEGADGFSAIPFGEDSINGLDMDTFDIRRPLTNDKKYIKQVKSSIMFYVPKSVKGLSLKLGEKKIDLPAPKVVPAYAVTFPKVTVDDVKWMHDREAKSVPSQTPYGTRLCIHVSPDEPHFYEVNLRALGLVTEHGLYHPVESAVDFASTDDLFGQGELGKRSAAKTGKHFVFIVPQTAKNFLLTYNGTEFARGKIPAFTGSTRPAYTEKSKVRFKVHGASLMKQATISVEKRYSLYYSEGPSVKLSVRHQPVLKGKFLKLALEGSAAWGTSSTYLLHPHGGYSVAFGLIDKDGKPDHGGYGLLPNGKKEVIYPVARIKPGTTLGISLNKGFDTDFFPAGKFTLR